MNITCEDRDRIFEDGTPAEWAALEAHSANCAACAEELRAWKALSVAAKEMRDYSDSPSLWPRIERRSQQKPPSRLTVHNVGAGSRWGSASLSDGKPQRPLPSSDLDSFRRLDLFASQASARSGPPTSRF